MATAPAIETVMDNVSTKIEALSPSFETSGIGGKFKRATQALDAAGVSAVRRQFDIRFRGGRDLSTEGRGIVTTGAGDREATLRVRVAYPLAPQRETASEKLLASDWEIIARGLGRGASWSGTPVQRTVSVMSARTDAADGAMVFLEIDLTIQYRDTET